MKTDLGAPKNIDTPFLRIRDNCLEMYNTTIQLSNISLFSTADITPEKFPMLSVAMIVAGFVIQKLLPLPAIILIILGGIWIYFWYSSVQKTKKMKRLTIVTNSGNVFPIVFEDQAFLAKVVTIMTEIIRDPAHAQNVTINIKDCTFSDESSVVDNLYEK